MIKVPEISVVCGDGFAQCKTVQNMGDSTAQLLGEAVDAPVVVPRQVPGMVQTVFDIPVVAQRQIPCSANGYKPPFFPLVRLWHGC